MPSKTDIWLPLYIGDFLADTTGLEAEKTGCYLLWLMRYWREGPLPNKIDELIESGKLRNPNARSIAEALLQKFFVLEKDGMWHQKRADAEIRLWSSKQQKAKEKAKNAAETRWKKDAPSIPIGSAPSNHEAMQEDCPSPSPSPSPSPEPEPVPKKQKLSRADGTSAKKVRHSTDPRHIACKEVVFAYYRSKNDGSDPPWDGAEGRELALVLKADPQLDATRLRRLLGNRYMSEVSHDERPSLWLRKVHSYASGPKNRFGQPLRQAGGKDAAVPNGTGEQIVGVLKESLERAERKNPSRKDGDLSPSGTA